MSETLSKSKGLTRRTFLKTTAAVAGAAATAGSFGCSSVDTAGDGSTPEGEQTFSNWCRGNCGSESRCCLETKVREGKVVSTMQRPIKGKDVSIQPGCVKGPANPQRIYGTHRLLYPMQQTGERGSDNWERISWDEALSLVAEKMQAAFDEYGPESVGFMSSYSGNSGVLSTVYSGFTNFPEARGACGIGPERFYQKTGVSLFTATGDLAQLYMQYAALAAPSNSSEDVANANTIIMFGANPCDSTRTAWSSIMDAKRNGSKLIVVDPRYSNTAAHADQWIPVRPGTDGALMLGMCNYIIDNDLIDYDYLRNRSVAPLLIKEDGTYLRLSELDLGSGEGRPEDPHDPDTAESESIAVWDEENAAFGSSFEVKNPAITGTFDANGVSVRPVYDLVRETIAPFTVEYAANECGLSAETIEGFAQTYATEGPSFIFIFEGMQHYQNSWHMYYDLPLLASLTGNACKPGTNYGLPGHGTPLFKKPVLNNTAALAIDNPKLNRMASLNQVPEIVESGTWNGEEYKLRLLWIAGCNVLGNGIGYETQIEAFKKIDFVVVASDFMNDTASQASLALPIAMTFEAEDYRDYMNQKAIEPVGEGKTDFEIFVGLAEAMGYDDLYDKDAEGYLREALDTEENLAAGLGYDAFHEQGVIYEDEIVRVENVAQETNATGRTQFYLEKLIPNGNFDQEITVLDRLPFYEHAYEAYPDNPLREQYPLFGISYHDNYTGHTMHSNVPWLNEIRGLDGEPYMVISETAAADRGIATGDMVRVYNERGHIVVRAVVSKGIREDTIQIPRGYEGGELHEGHLQSLTTIDAKDRITNNDSHNDWLCQVELYEGGAQ